MTKASSEILCDRSRYIYIGRSHTRRSVFFCCESHHIYAAKVRSSLLDSGLPAVLPADTSNAHTGLSNFEAPEHQPCAYGKQEARKCARCTRAADKRTCVHRTQLAESFSRICWSSKETAESKRNITCKHTGANVKQLSHPFTKASTKPGAATRHLATFISANQSAVRIEGGLGSIMSTASVVVECSKAPQPPVVDTHAVRLHRLDCPFRDG